PARTEESFTVLPPGLSGAPALGTIWQAFRRSWKTVLPLAILGAALGAGLAWYLVPPQYTSAITFGLGRPPASSENTEENVVDMQKAEMAFMKNHDILTEAIEKSRVAELYGETWTAQRLDKKLLVQFTTGQRLMMVTPSHENPEVAAALLSAIGEVYPSKVRESDRVWMDSRIAQLRRRLEGEGPGRKDERGGATLADQLRDKRTELNEAFVRHGLDDTKTASFKYQNAELMLSQTQKDRSAKQRERIALQAALVAAEKRIKEPLMPRVTDADAEESLRGDPDYVECMAELLLQKKMLAGYLR